MKKIAVVTGATRGLGLATAEALTKKSYSVILAGRDLEKLKQKAKDISRFGEVYPFVLDVSDNDSIKNFSASVLDKFPRVDVLVNNAGIFLDERDKVSALLTEAEAIKKTFNTNTMGAILLIQKFLPAMIKNNFGRVVNVSSGMGQLSEMNSGYLAYRVSKTALNAVTRVFSEEVKGKNILINSVCPGWVRTDMGGANAERTIEQGISGIVWAATLPEDGPTGGFFRDGKRLEW